MRPLGEECFADNCLRALENKEKIHTGALESRPAGGKGMDSGREASLPLTRYQVQKVKALVEVRVLLTVLPIPAPSHFSPEGGTVTI